LKAFRKSLITIKVPGVGLNLVPDCWTADGENAFPELGPSPHYNSCVISRLHDRANIEQTSSKCIQTIYANCSMFARCLLDRVNGVLDAEERSWRRSAPQDHLHCWL